MIGSPDALVVGAGFAGVAAATALAQRGARVAVLEARQRSGGRACSWIDPATGEVRDNGQHVLGGFYDETLRLLDRIGTADALSIDPSFRLHLWERGRGEYELNCPRLPAPLHWLAALARCSRFSVPARAAALQLHAKARALLGVNGTVRERTVEEWLSEPPGHADLMTVLRPIALAALNEDPRHGSAALLARVLDRLLSAPASRSGLALPRRGLADLLLGYERYIESRGGEVRYRATVLGLRIAGGRIDGVSLLGGGRLDAPAVILAVPHERAGWILPPRQLDPLRGAATTPWSPIVSAVHAFDRPILPARFVGLLGIPTQWAFDRGPLASGGHAVGTLRSAAFADAERVPTDIADETTADLREAFPLARTARLLSARVYKERRATIRSTPEVQALRPGATTGVKGLFLAGDWTDTGLPPTIEGAVQSGHHAAGLLR